VKATPTRYHGRRMALQSSSLRQFKQRNDHLSRSPLPMVNELTCLTLKHLAVLSIRILPRINCRMVANESSKHRLHGTHHRHLELCIRQKHSRRRRTHSTLHSLPHSLRKDLGLVIVNQCLTNSPSRLLNTILGCTIIRHRVWVMQWPARLLLLPLCKLLPLPQSHSNEYITYLEHLVYV
jgi:hypothetical protein